jgi:hypothetical protein
MTKRLVVIGLLVALAGLGAYFLLAGHGGNGGRATYAQLQPVHGPAAIEVWRDHKGRLTFHWLGDHPGEVDRYDPSTLALGEFSDGQALGSTTFLSSRAAWRHIRALYGVTAGQITNALASGTRSAEPPAYRIGAPQHRSSDLYEGFTDYGTNIGRMAHATGLVLPRLTSFESYPLMGAGVGSDHLAGLSYGPHPLGDSVIDVDFAKSRPGDRKGVGTVYKTMFNSPRWRHHDGPVPYAQIGGGQIIFPYRSEWVGVTTMRGNPGTRGWAKIIRAILAAPTR